MIQRLALDAPFFEQVLSALSLVQQLKEQIPQGSVNDPEAGLLSELVETQQAIETETVDLEATLSRLVSLARLLTPARGAAVWFFTEHDFVCRAATDGLVGDEGLRQEVMARLLVSEVANRDGWRNTAAAQSLLVAPIHQGRDIVGALAVFSPAPNAFRERDGTCVRLLSGLLAHALRRTADAELRQVVSLERAAMLEAMDQIMPALRRMAEDGGGESGCGAGTVTMAELEPAMEPTPEPVPDGLGIVGDVATGEVSNPVSPLVRGAEAEVEAAGNAGELPNVFLLLQEETEREAKTPVVVNNGTSEAEDCEVAVEPAEQPIAQVGTEKMQLRVPDEPATEDSSRAAAGPAGRLIAARLAARMWSAARRLEDVGSGVMVASRRTGLHLRLLATRGLESAMWMPRQLRSRGVQLSAALLARLRRKSTPVVVAAVKSHLSGLAKAALGKLRAGRNASWERCLRATRRAAVPVLVLLIVAAHLIMTRTGGVPSHAESRDRHLELLPGASASATSPAIEQQVSSSAKPHSATVSRPQTPPGTKDGVKAASTSPRWVWVGENELDYLAQGVKVRYFIPRPPPQQRLGKTHVKYIGEDVIIRYFTPEQAAGLPSRPAGSAARPAQVCTAGGVCPGGRENWPGKPQYQGKPQ
ncbi:MAG TPA: hypothetical protein VEI01_11105 [Terriglobales bacterium]|nr:hypothetical protein [Terriglobales bacterium]